MISCEINIFLLTRPFDLRKRAASHDAEENVMDVKVSTEESLRNAEEARCRALMAGDAALLADMVTDDLVHIHLTGKVDDKPCPDCGGTGKVTTGIGGG